MTWKASADHFGLSVGLARFDSPPPDAVAGPVTARLDIDDLLADGLGVSRGVGVDLSAADARLLAAALVTVAAQLEDLQRQEVA